MSSRVAPRPRSRLSIFTRWISLAATREDRSRGGARERDSGGSALQGAFVAWSPASAVRDGRQPRRQPGDFNRAFQARRQMGSRSSRSSTTAVPGARSTSRPPRRCPTAPSIRARGSAWTPKNFDDSQHRGDARRGAQTVAEHRPTNLVDQIRPDGIARAGDSSARRLKPVPSIGLRATKCPSSIPNAFAVFRHRGAGEASPIRVGVDHRALGARPAAAWTTVIPKASRRS